VSTTYPAITDAGRLDRRVLLQREVTTQDEYGEVVITWQDVAEVWAEMRPLRGTERIDAAQLVAQFDTSWRIRWRPDVRAAGWRVRYDGRDHDVKSVAELGHRELLQLDTLWTDSPEAAQARVIVQRVG
jgi:SPP1 family predicted phage head-tail adaptor